MAEDLPSRYRAFVQCMNEGRWQGFRDYAHSTLTHNSREFTPETYAAHVQSVGDFELTVDAITTDRASNRLAANLAVTFRPAIRLMGVDPNGQDLTFTEQHFVWFTDHGKVAKVLMVADHDAIEGQLTGRASPGSAGNAGNALDLLGSHGLGHSLGLGLDVSGSSGNLPAPELEQTYRAYIACINARTMETELARFCHQRVVHNTKTLSLDQYRQLMKDAFAAIDGIEFALHTVIADEATQRVAARIEFHGTPVAKFAGVEANGRSVSFAEHVTYQFEAGRIARVWSLVDWASYRQQMLARPES
ncbi:SnoaL-domain-containing protein [Xylariomycetidae sp. FL0641]|nr:SnoaL-domain-containing protein [Xylariomycetidae sp. FL0641]